MPTTKLKSDKELEQTACAVAFLWQTWAEKGDKVCLQEAIALLRKEHIHALEAAVEIVRDHASTMRGAHVNTNESCGTIRRALLTQIEELKRK